MTDTAIESDSTIEDPPVRSSRRESLLAFLFFLGTAIAFAFPLSPTKWRTHIPGNQGDALLNLWILRWVGHHVDNGWGALWDTSIFHPHANTLAYSESMIPIALIHRVLAFVTRSDVLAFNIVYVATWALSGWLMYLLARRLTANATASIVAGLVYTLATPRLIRYGFFQLGFGCFLPLVVLLVILLFEKKRISTGIALGATTALLALSSSYYGLVAIIALAIVMPILLVWNRESWREIVKPLAAAALVGAVLVLPAVYQYRELQQDSHFSREPERAGSARAEDFLRVAPDNYVLADLPPFESRSRPESATIEQRLFPGVIGIAFGVVGVIALIRKRSAVGRTMIALSAAAVVLHVLSTGIGPDAFWDLPGFGSIRAPARFGVFPHLVGALFAAFGIAAVLAWIKKPGWRIALSVLLVGAVYAESASALQFSRVPNDERSKAVNEQLADLPAGTVAELPMRRQEDGSAWPYIEMPRQWLSVIDGNERVGGYSGYSPPGFGAVADSINTFPSSEAMATLDDLGVRYVVLRLSYPAGLVDYERESLTTRDLGPFTEAEADTILASLPEDSVKNLGRYGDAWLLEIVPDQ